MMQLLGMTARTNVHWWDSTINFTINTVWLKSELDTEMVFPYKNQSIEFWTPYQRKNRFFFHSHGH